VSRNNPPPGSVIFVLKHLRENRFSAIVFSRGLHPFTIFPHRDFFVVRGKALSRCRRTLRRSHGRPCDTYRGCGSQSGAQGLNLSSYSTANGGALDFFAGAHVHDYISVQGDFLWNRNRLQLNANSSGTGSFYQDKRNSSQEAAIVSFLLYFRQRSSRIRPYLAIGTGVAHLSSRRQQLSSSGAITVPPADFSTSGPVVRTHVGIDVRLRGKLDFRYSFSETLGSNKIGQELSPPGTHKLANYQNLFGFIVRF